ncbi:hypothetical protein CEXT_763461 [Caerostris extrusa]|uniref:Uncharacterized protein n=1 Tax=Caerostris extrusa TaxID=172846 RepID=A0AAV4WTZ9_CAEEX|nr:hypothetical protein CEXT_763461 [Caerostris extrusa]
MTLPNIWRFSFPSIQIYHQIISTSNFWRFSFPSIQIFIIKSSLPPNIWRFSFPQSKFILIKSSPPPNIWRFSFPSTQVYHHQIISSSKYLEIFISLNPNLSSSNHLFLQIFGDFHFPQSKFIIIKSSPPPNIWRFSFPSIQIYHHQIISSSKYLEIFIFNPNLSSSNHLFLQIFGDFHFPQSKFIIIKSSLPPNIWRFSFPSIQIYHQIISSSKLIIGLMDNWLALWPLVPEASGSNPWRWHGGL